MDLDDKKINDFVGQMLKYQEERKNKALSVAELKEVAMSVGIQEFEWNEMQTAANNDIIAAKKHFNHQNFDDAFNTAKKTLTLNPYNFEALEIMSNSALKIYKTEKNEKYKEYAKKYANEALMYSPNQNWAFRVLADLDKLEEQHKQNSTKKIMITASIVAVSVLVIGITFAVKGVSKSRNSNVKFKIIEAQENAKAQWAQVENVINRRDQIIPELLVAVNFKNDDYKKTLNELNELKEKLKNADKKDKMDIHVKLQEKTRELTTIISQNIDSENVELLLVQIEGTYNRISVETKYYNEAVREYNIMVQKYSDVFPEFKQMPYYGE